MRKSVLITALLAALALAAVATGARFGSQGPAWAPSYGIAQVLVDRGDGGPVPWATYSTSLGSPAGDTTGGAFRFTCHSTQAPCKVSLQASTTDPGAVSLYPRVILYREDLNGGPSTECEYGDGTDNSGGVATLTSSTPTPVTLGIGGSLDCNAGQPYPTGGIASEIWVPAGYYDVFSTFVFKK